MAAELDKSELIQKSFRRASLTTQGIEMIETSRIPIILSQLGQPFDQKVLADWIKEADPKNLGKLDYDGFKKCCQVFLKDPAALSRFEGDEFSFKHLITPADFE